MPLSMHSGRRNEPFNEKKGALDYDTTGRRSEKEKRPALQMCCNLGLVPEKASM
jgi:hypothetical protein